MSLVDKARLRRLSPARALFPLLCAVAVLCVTPELLQAQSITGPAGAKRPSNPIEVLQMLRIEWGLDLAASPVDGGSYLRVGDELTEGLTDLEAASETLVARIYRAVKLINSSRWSQEQLVAIKRAASLAENRIIAAVDGFK